ncbi:MAG: TonB-dependent receptor, partial [Phycisphaeraceae bacterium]|nr:TonB-dependent receptor [Phycisphaeraceae bacterium]
MTCRSDVTRLAWSALAAAALITGPALAADDPAAEPADANSNAETTESTTDPQSAYLPTSTVIGSKEAARRLPGSGTYLDTEDIRTHGYDDINQVLRKVPGVYIREEEGFGLFPNISLRGVDPGRSSKVTLMEDGIPAAPAVYSAPSAYYSPVVGRMAGVEVLKGSSQVRYGPHTTGGVVNYISTPIPTELKLYSRNQWGVFTENGRDAFRTHTYIGDTLDLDSAGHFGYVIEGYFRDNEGFKDIVGAPGSDVHDTGLENAHYMAKIAWEPDSEIDQRFEFKIAWNDREAGVSYLGLTESDFDSDPHQRYAASRFDEFKSFHNQMYLRHTIEPADWVNITSTAYYTRFHRNWEKLQTVNGNSQATVIAGGGNDLAVMKGNAAGNFNVRANNRDYVQWGVQSFAEFLFETGEVNHELTAGVRYHEDRIRRYQWSTDYTQDANGNITGRTRNQDGSAGNRRQESKALALSLEDRLTFGNWAITPGIRVEQIEHQWTEYSRNPSSNVTDRNEGSLTMVAGGVGATYDWNDQWQTFGGLHRGVSPPSPRASVRSNIEEESSLAFELGQRFEDKERALQAEATFFYTKFDDLIVTDNVGGSGSGNTENVGEIDSMGLELSAQWDPGTHYGWGVKNPWFLAFTYTNAELNGDANSEEAESVFSGGKDGNDVPYIPEFQFTIGTGLDFDRFGFDARLSWVDDVYATANNSSSQ